MKDKLEKCEQYRDKRSSPSATEKGKTFQLNNKNKREVACIKIDNCVFTQADGIKCDYLFEVTERKRLYYVELKGSDISKAVDQINATLKQTKKEYPGWIYEARIVAGGKVPAGISDRKEYEKLRSMCTGGSLTIHHKMLHIEPLD